MSLSGKLGRSRSNSLTALSHALVHLPEADHAESFIQEVANLGQITGAHLRGLTVIDTVRLQELVSDCESAAYAVHELDRIQSRAKRREAVRAAFSTACLAAGIDFGLQQCDGATLDVLTSEVGFHDLFITSVASKPRKLPGEWSAAELLELILTGAAPVLALREGNGPIRRILLVQDGSHAGSRAIRAYLTQQLFPEAVHRLLAVHAGARQAESILREGNSYVRRHVPHFETGYLAGRPAQVLPEYIRRWEADLVVLGAQRRTAFHQLLSGEIVRAVFRNTSCSLYSTR